MASVFPPSGITWRFISFSLSSRMEKRKAMRMLLRRECFHFRHYLQTAFLITTKENIVQEERRKERKFATFGSSDNSSVCMQKGKAHHPPFQCSLSAFLFFRFPADAPFSLSWPLYKTPASCRCFLLRRKSPPRTLSWRHYRGGNKKVPTVVRSAFPPYAWWALSVTV